MTWKKIESLEGGIIFLNRYRSLSWYEELNICANCKQDLLFLSKLRYGIRNLWAAEEKW